MNEEEKESIDFTHCKYCNAERGKPCTSLGVNKGSIIKSVHGYRILKLRGSSLVD